MPNQYTYTCLVCGTQFQTSNSKRKTCGITCGKVQRARSRTRTPEQARIVFWSHVDCSEGADACWKWTSGTSSEGYGVMRWRGKDRKAHRISYELAYGAPPDDLLVLHSCDNPPCCNPVHLFLGTNKDNSDDKIRKGRAINLRGERHGMAKLTDAQVDEIRQRYTAGGVTQTQLGAEYGVTHTMIGYIVRRVNRT